MIHTSQHFSHLLRFFAGTRLFTLVLVWLMVILVWGTIAEKTVGLYAAEQRYFSSYIIWLYGWLPLPGLLTVVMIIFLGLLARLALETWRWQKLGTIIIHIGAALLLFGGSVTALVSREGTMIIPTNATRNYMEDARHVELAIAELQDNKVINETIISGQQLAAGKIDVSGLPFTIQPVSWCRNCALVRLPDPTAGAYGVAINFILKDIPRAAEDEQNHAGFTFRLANTPNRDGLYAIFQDMPIPEIVAVNGKNYLFTIRYARTILPFAIQLQRFQEDLYPDTNKPRAYQSDIIMHDNGIMWPHTIRMNEPLRYKGYTFYQSSFLTANGETTTVLSVVKNAGRLLPYLSGAIIALGFLIHILQRFWRQKPIVAV